MTTKLEIIGPYTPEHEGPFCTRDGKSVRILCTDRKGIPPIVGLAQDGDMELIVIAGSDGVTKTMSRNYDLMNAREVRVLREVWLPQFENGDLLGVPMNTKEKAEVIREANRCVRLIHFREVLEGE
ncbi:hypothetical protein [Acetobacter sp. DsW_059]|uniref:hypothetical protein n=1 Tax=Acetobacter sp. DsW_059 TaxID=1670661 RepID=UPI000A3CC229|nr:hypothetical protein [Acetobacter sp. DsW_059]OUJ10312.1 hypothetical protein HK25_07010 [Acetobacter sp. DsW_059]